MKDAHPIEQLSALHDGALEPRERDVVESHLAHCPDCRAMLADLAALDAALASSPVPDPGPAYWARFADRVEARTRPAPEPARGYERLTAWLFSGGHFAWPRAVGALAACTLVLYVGLRGVHTDETILAPRREVPQLKAPELDVAVPRADAPPAASAPAPQSAPAPAPPPPPATATQPSFDDQRAGGPTLKEADQAQEAKPPGTLEEAVAQKNDATALEKQEYAAAPPAEAVDAARQSQAAKRSFEMAPRADVPPSTLSQPVAPSAGAMKQSQGVVHLRQPSLAVPPPAPVDSLLAADLRLWERHEDPAVRMQLEQLATQLAGRRHDPRAVARARERLAWLASTTTNAAERERWLAIERNLPPP